MWLGKEGYAPLFKEKEEREGYNTIACMLLNPYIYGRSGMDGLSTLYIYIISLSTFPSIVPPEKMFNEGGWLFLNISLDWMHPLPILWIDFEH